MERTKFYTKEDFEEALGMNSRLISDWIHRINDPKLQQLYHGQKYFSHAQFDYIINRLHSHLGINDSESGDNRGGGNSNV